jgi:aspartyl/glutamyl-tRNA(Asn/Gln) amidotransferase C subunit
MDNVFREDKLQASMPLDAVLRNAPDRADEFFRVPRIVED